MSDLAMDRHYESFEKEAKLMRLHSQVISYLYKWKDFMAVARALNPDLCTDAFERKPCKRRLTYIGEAHEFFINGNVYDSLTFNGATYTIDGYGNGESTIGCVHFQRVGC